MTALDAALGRAVNQDWSYDTSNVDAEQAFIDRRVLAEAVNRLREAVRDYQSRVAEMQDDIDQLHQDSIEISGDLQRVQDQMQILALAHWVEVEPGEFVNPEKVHWVRDLAPDDEGSRCQVLLGTTGLTVHHPAGVVVQMLSGGLE